MYVRIMINCPPLGTVPVLIDDTPKPFNKLDIVFFEMYVGQPYPTEYHIMIPDYEFLKGLLKKGAEIEPAGLSNVYKILTSRYVAYYPPLGMYIRKFNIICVVSGIAGLERLPLGYTEYHDLRRGIIVHEAIHYHLYNTDDPITAVLRIRDEVLACFFEKWAYAINPSLKPRDIAEVVVDNDSYKRICHRLAELYPELGIERYCNSQSMAEKIDFILALLRAGLISKDVAKAIVEFIKEFNDKKLLDEIRWIRPFLQDLLKKG